MNTVPMPTKASLERAAKELQAGNFTSVRVLTTPYEGKGNVDVDILAGLAQCGCGEVEAAAQRLSRVTRDNPGLPYPGVRLIELLGGLDQRDAGRPVLARCVELLPDDPRAYEAFALLLVQLGEFDEAVRIQQQAVALATEKSGFLLMLGSIMAEAGRIDEGAEILSELVDNEPDNFGAVANLACLYTANGQMQKSLDLYQKVVPMSPHDPRIRLNHSIALLKAGRFTQGWAEHEWRLKLPGHTPLPRETLLPNVTASLDLRGKRVLVTHEEGLGDTLMYLRYLPELARRGAIVQLVVPAGIVPLAERIEGVSLVWTAEGTPDFDWHCPFISLPRALAISPLPRGEPVPYLHASAEKIARWEQKLAGLTGLRVGLVWGGAPRPKQTIPYMIDRKRSIPMQYLQPLSKVRGINLVSLQMGPARDRLATEGGGLRVLDLMDEIADMDDTAALIMALDVVVSVDTSVVHLAGALGKPVLMLDRFDNCWRWMTGRTDSDWYPDLQIFRQKQLFAWEDPVRAVCTELRAMVAARRRAA